MSDERRAGHPQVVEEARVGLDRADEPEADEGQQQDEAEGGAGDERQGPAETMVGAGSDDGQVHRTGGNRQAQGGRAHGEQQG